MMNWIDINLPWAEEYDANGPRPEYVEPSNLDEEMKKVFGYTEEELITRYFGECKYYIQSEVYEEYRTRSQAIEDELYSKRPTPKDIEEEVDRRLLALNNPAVNATLEFFAKVRPIHAWLEEHPSTKLNSERNDAIQEAFLSEQRKKANSFTTRGLAKSGTLMEVKQGDKVTRMLIGDINALGGVCDDCTGIAKGDIVLRYCVLWNKTECV